jgi:hypothetical protein
VNTRWEPTAELVLYIIVIAEEMALNGDKDRIKVQRGDIDEPDLHRPVSL